MSTVTAITIPKDYGYVLLSASSTLLLTVYHSFRVGGYRKAAKIPYPQHYASQAEITSAPTSEQKKALYLFNCAQRAHGNFLENFPQAIISLLIAGLEYPKTAAVLGGVWSVGRVVYAMGYTDPNKEMGKGRLYGSFYALGQLGLIGLVTSMAVKMVMA